MLASLPRRTPFILALLAACGPKIGFETDTTTDSSSTSEPTTVASTAATDGPDSDPTVDPDGGSDDGPGPTQRAVDILFVIDNSGSMGEEQATLALSIESLVGTLDAATPPVDYRIGVTTTDNGNPWCTSTSPEAGNLRATSCRERATEFVFNGATTLDLTQEVCYDPCTLESLEITDGSPWIDVARSTGTSNLSGDVVENLRCMLPQGIDGCGFEQPLESMWKAVRRFELDGDPSFGFHRDGALLAVVFVTDEVDCSYNTEWDSIFLPDGNRVFWSDPAAASPTSAVCWNAGVACNGNDCFSVDLDVDGNETADPDAAVLRPLERYIELLQEAGAYAFAIHGVLADGNVVYQESLDDPFFQDDFGIGPGCESAAGRAVPPVRARELVGTISGSGHEASICLSDFDNAMTSFAQGIVARLP